MGINKTHLVLCIILLLPSLVIESVMADSAQSDLVLIAHRGSGIEHLSKREVINIYLGRYRRLETGSTAMPIDIAAKGGSKAIFYRQLVDKNLAEINAYWSRLVFSGKTRPPQQVDTVDEALQRVIESPNALAYVHRADVNSQVIIVFEWSDT